MRQSRCAIAIMLVIGLLGIAAACGDDDEGDTGEPTTTEAPATATAPATEEATTEDATTEEATTEEATTEEQPAGDAAAGEQVFAANCESCHLEGGREAGTGPALDGGDLTEQGIRDQIVNGGGGMPAGLVSGEDLDDVTAYVLSLQ